MTEAQEKMLSMLGLTEVSEATTNDRLEAIEEAIIDLATMLTEEDKTNG